MSRMAIFDVPLAELRTRGTIKWQRFEADVIPMFVAEMDAHIAPAVRERLEREFNLDLISTAPNVVYRVVMEDGSEHTVTNPSEYPTGKIAEVYEPVVRGTILAPSEYIGTILELCQTRRGIQRGLEVQDLLADGHAAASQTLNSSKTSRSTDICRNSCIWVLLYAYELSTFDAGFVGGAVGEQCGGRWAVLGGRALCPDHRRGPCRRAAG